MLQTPHSPNNNLKKSNNNIDDFNCLLQMISNKLVRINPSKVKKCINNNTKTSVFINQSKRNYACFISPALIRDEQEIENKPLASTKKRMIFTNERKEEEETSDKQPSVQPLTNIFLQLFNNRKGSPNGSVTA
ncbi:hypothetical protein ABK040_005939 [Willaertia magna]